MVGDSHVSGRAPYLPIGVLDITIGIGQSGLVMDSAGGEPLAATELVNVSTVSVEYGGSTPLDVGDTILHAVVNEVMSPICGQNSRRLLPTGLPWVSVFPEHLQRCSHCLALCPID
jgi:hypothetical protein